MVRVPGDDDDDALASLSPFHQNPQSRRFMVRVFWLYYNRSGGNNYRESVHDCPGSYGSLNAHILSQLLLGATRPDRVNCFGSGLVCVFAWVNPLRTNELFFVGCSLGFLRLLLNLFYRLSLSRALITNSVIRANLMIFCFALMINLFEVAALSLSCVEDLPWWRQSFLWWLASGCSWIQRASARVKSSPSCHRASSISSPWCLFVYHPIHRTRSNKTQASWAFYFIFHDDHRKQKEIVVKRRERVRRQIKHPSRTLAFCGCGKPWPMKILFFVFLNPFS